MKLIDVGSNTSVYLSSATIWVEGVTDRQYLRQYLRMYEQAHADAPRLVEDVHYSFVEYAGANVEHWSFDDAHVSDAARIAVKRLCARAFVVMDRDEEEAKAERKKRLQKELGNRFYLLARREVENLLPVEALKGVLPHK